MSVEESGTGSLVYFMLSIFYTYCFVNFFEFNFGNLISLSLDVAPVYLKLLKFLDNK